MSCFIRMQITISFYDFFLNIELFNNNFLCIIKNRKINPLIEIIQSSLLKVYFRKLECSAIKEKNVLSNLLLVYLQLNEKKTNKVSIH